MNVAPRVAERAVAEGPGLLRCHWGLLPRGREGRLGKEKLQPPPFPPDKKAGGPSFTSFTAITGRVSVEPECSEVINGPNLGGFLGLAPNL